MRRHTRQQSLGLRVMPTLDQVREIYAGEAILDARGNPIPFEAVMNDPGFAIAVTNLARARLNHQGPRT